MKKERFEITRIDPDDSHFRYQGKAIGSIVEPCGEIEHLGGGWYSGSFKVLKKSGSELAGKRLFYRIKLKKVRTVLTERRDKR